MIIRFWNCPFTHSITHDIKPFLTLLWAIQTCADDSLLAMAEKSSIEDLLHQVTTTGSTDEDRHLRKDSSDSSDKDTDNDDIQTAVGIAILVVSILHWLRVFEEVTLCQDIDGMGTSFQTVKVWRIVNFFTSILGPADKEGQCGDVCATLCNHQLCFPDFFSSNPDLCTCINGAVSNCGPNTRCDVLSETCVCLPGFSGDPLVGCSSITVPPTPAPAAAPTAPPMAVPDPFDIQLAFSTNVPDNVRNIVTAQAQTWEGVITEGLLDETFESDPSNPSVSIDPCEPLGIDPCPCSALPETIDDLYICTAFVRLEPTTLGSTRIFFGDRRLPIAADMRFNSDLPTDGQRFLDTVVRSCAVHCPSGVDGSTLDLLTFFCLFLFQSLHSAAS